MKNKLHDLIVNELNELLKTKKEELRKMRFSLGVNKMIQKPAQYKKLKKEIARILTILTEKE